MAAPIVAGVAAMMVALNPGLSASELRARLLQHAGRSPLPVAAGYVDALESVRSVTTAVGQESTQRPRLRILRATAERRRTQVQVAVSGSTQAIKRYGIRLDRSPAPRSPRAARPSPSRCSAAGKRVRIDALDAAGTPAGDGHAPRHPAARGQARRHPRARGRHVIEALLLAPSPPRSARRREPHRRSAVTLSGSTTALPVVADLAYFYAPHGPDAPRFAIVGGGTQTGITDAARGITSAGMVSRDADRPGPARARR